MVNLSVWFFPISSNLTLYTPFLLYIWRSFAFRSPCFLSLALSSVFTGILETAVESAKEYLCAAKEIEIMLLALHDHEQNHSHSLVDVDAAERTTISQLKEDITRLEADLKAKSDLINRVKSNLHDASTILDQAENETSQIRQTLLPPPI